MAMAMVDGRRCLLVVGDDHLTGWHPPENVMPGWRVMPHTLCGASLARMESVVMVGARQRSKYRCDAGHGMSGRHHVSPAARCSAGSSDDEP